GAQPRDRKEQANDRRNRCQRRPQSFPENRPARTPQRARERVSARAFLRRERVRGRGVGGPSGQAHLQKKESADINMSPHTRQPPKGRHMKTTSAREGSAPSRRVQSQGGRWSSAIRSETSRRGRTSAHSFSRTRTSGTKARVL